MANQLDAVPPLPPELLGISPESARPAFDPSVLQTGRQIESLLAGLSQKVPGLSGLMAQFIPAMRAALARTIQQPGGSGMSPEGGPGPMGSGMMTFRPPLA